MHPLPIVESCPMCVYAMIRQPDPTRVTPPPFTVPREMVTYSRMELLSPTSIPVGSPAYFKSCGGIPRHANESILLPHPNLLWPSSTTWLTSSQSSPSATFGPIVQYGPTRQLAGTTAPSATI